jgi:hypothetical protein
MNKVIVAGITADGFHIAKKCFPLPPEFDDLLVAHGQQLRALLDRPVLVAITWNDGDDAATATVVDPTVVHEFKTVRLPFPEASWS